MQAAVGLKVAVFIVPRYGEPGTGQMHPNLVGTPGLDGYLQQGELRHAPGNFDQRNGFHTLRVVLGHHFDPPLALFLAAFAGQMELGQRLVQHFFVSRPLALHQRQVGFTGFTAAELVLQPGQGRALFGHQQNARGLPVQAVHQFQKWGLGPGTAQLLDHAKTQAAATVHRHARGLIDGQNVLVLQQHRKCLGGR